MTRSWTKSPTSPTADRGTPSAEPASAEGEAIYQALRRMVRDLLARKAGGHLVEPALAELDLSLPLHLKGLHAEPSAFAAHLQAVLEEQIDEAIRHAAAFRPGHAFCHRCATADCEHSLPPAPDQVFVDYGPTGTPTWMSLAQYCLEVRHPEVDRLYADPPAFVTLVHDADALRGRLLDAWQNPVYELLGQLTAGYFRVPGPSAQREVLALTLQVTAATAGRKGSWRLGLNILGRSPDGEPLGLRWERQQEPPWRRAVLWAQAALASVGGRGRRRPGRREVEQRVAGILNGLARRLERDQRGRSRRTGHAERRHRSGERPTRKALDDIRLAGRDAVLVDERSGALVVLGDRGRTHFFTPEGRLVSSVRYSRDAIERKRKQGLWRPAPHEEADALLRRLAADAGP